MTNGAQEPLSKYCKYHLSNCFSFFLYFLSFPLQSNLIQGFDNGHHSNRMGQSGRATWPSGSMIGCSILFSTGVESQTISANQTRHIVTQALDSSTAMQPESRQNPANCYRSGPIVITPKDINTPSFSY